VAAGWSRGPCEGVVPMANNARAARLALLGGNAEAIKVLLNAAVDECVVAQRLVGQFDPAPAHGALMLAERPLEAALALVRATLAGSLELKRKED
jgi:hypothetical protein